MCTDQEQEDAYCPACNGSGEGMYDGTRCSTCKGRGHIRPVEEVDDNRDDFDIWEWNDDD